MFTAYCLLRKIRNPQSAITLIPTQYAVPTMNLETLNLHGYTVSEALTRFVEQYNRTLAAGRAEGLDVIHGKGRAESGGLREALREYLQSQGTRIKGFDAQLAMRGADYLLNVPGKLAYMHGEDARNNAGCTIVVPFQRLTVPHDWVRYKY
jgi:hypothetical protein